MFRQHAITLARLTYLTTLCRSARSTTGNRLALFSSIFVIVSKPAFVGLGHDERVPASRTGSSPHQPFSIAQRMLLTVTLQSEGGSMASDAFLFRSASGFR
jgi:hypothetical protein